jgi:hypothetical protein
MNVKPVAAAMVAAALAAGTIAVAPQASADGCQTVQWGFLGFKRRTLCDSPIGPDGSWMRHRTVYAPGRYVPASCDFDYYITCYDGYSTGPIVSSDETYPVSPETVLPDEPGHLP